MGRRLCIALWVAAMLLSSLTACGTKAPVRHDPTVVVDPATRDARIKADLESLRTQVETYFQRYGELPERLPALRDTPDGVAIIETLPLDPWRVPYLLRRLDDDVEIYTGGADLIIGSDDDTVLRLSFAGVTPREAPAGETQ